MPTFHYALTLLNTNEYFEAYLPSDIVSVILFACRHLKKWRSFEYSNTQVRKI